MRKRKRKPKVLEASYEELQAIVQRSVESPLSTKDREILLALIETTFWTKAELEKGNATLAHIRKSLSISTKKTEKTSDVLKCVDGSEQPPGNDEKRCGEKPEKEKEQEKKRKKGHGRNGTDAYTGAEKIKVSHESHKAGERCSLCGKGKLCRHKPRRLIRLRGQAPIQATKWELERLRCNLCGEVFTAEAPAGVGEKKYDESAASMIGLLKYGSGMPFNRLARLEESFGIPLPVSTQWDIVAERTEGFVPAWEEMIRQGAQGEIFHNDDTSMKILDFLKENERIKELDPKARTGIFTSCVVAIVKGQQIVLFFTGRQHAGENLRDVLKRRAAELDPPIQMADALTRNEPKDFETIMCNCLGHGRRKFVAVVDSFPGECRHMLETLRQVYRHDAIAREQEMSQEERLRYHQAHSSELMEDLRIWMSEQLAEKKVELSSSLGDAFSYMLNRWEKLTQFLRVPGAPLDNNICERALKKAILHRKNALFYKTENGARVGDINMSLIYTAEVNGANPFDYLVELQKHGEELRENPQRWMPWNYRATLAALDGAAATDDRPLP